MKKVFWVIALVAMGLTVVPQIQAQDVAKLERLQAELEQIVQQAERSGWTPQMTQRMNEIQQEIVQAMGPMGGLPVPAQPNQQANQQAQQALQQAQQREQQQQQQREQNARADYIREHTGTNRNWPAASVLNRYQINLRQPSGTTVSYTSGDTYIYIYLHNAGNNTMQEIKRQIEAATKKTMESFGSNGWRISISTGQYTGFLYIVEQQYDVITIELPQFDNSKG